MHTLESQAAHNAVGAKGRMNGRQKPRNDGKETSETYCHWGIIIKKLYRLWYLVGGERSLHIARMFTQCGDRRIGQSHAVVLAEILCCPWH